MMDMSLEEIKESSELFTALIDMINERKMKSNFVYAVLAKLTVLYALNDGDKEEFMHRMGFVYDFEKLMKPESDEVH
jgi:hypothetical protein